jgi:hypothetical protein
MDVLYDLHELYKNRAFSPNPLYEQSLERALTPRLAYGTPAMHGITGTVLSARKMIAYNLVQNAIDEAKGAARIQVIADKYAEPELYKKMHRHVGEELKHSKLFYELVSATGFQTTEAPGDHRELVEEVLDFEDDLRAFICRVHSIEIRSWTVLRMYQQELERRTFPDLSDTALPVIADIMQDEINHVFYTGQQIDEWLLDDPSLQPTLDECFAHTNRETWQDMASMITWLANNFEDALGDGKAALEAPTAPFLVGEMGPPATLT